MFVNGHPKNTQCLQMSYFEANLISVVKTLNYHTV